jgi:NAD(P)-dependent dehydrogenase (short-subunit alcohol dehydrogenase family)
MNKNIFSLEDRVAVVTGGLGIQGKEFCRGLAKYGANVVVVDLDEQKVKEFANSLEEDFKTKCVGISCDITNEDSVIQMSNKSEEIFGKIDILHNNAAAKTKNLDDFFKPAEEFKLETWKEVMSVNLDGMFLVAREIGSKMVKKKSGSIIQTSSIYGGSVGVDHRIYEGSHYLGTKINTPPVYAASKGGVVGLTLYLATYWAKDGIRVNTLTPGGIESGQNDVFIENYSNRVPLKRMGRKNECVGALIFLASDASSYVTGQNIIVDGGLSAW